MRTSGVLMPIFSLPSKYGIGTLGKAAYDFVDFLNKAGQTYWQILPVGITGFGDSPYQSISSYAGNPYFIDLDFLIEDGLLKKENIEEYDWGTDAGKVDYELMYQNRYAVLRVAFESFKNNISDDYNDFCEQNSGWLDNYSLYAAIKKNQDFASFDCWDEPLKLKNPDALAKVKIDFAEDIFFYKMLQYLFAKQWFRLKEYANKKGVYIIGDIPIYVALDSADVWGEPEQFQLDDEFKPVAVAGCPPDAFSEDGQLWGNPLYNWDYMEKDGFSWWINRIGYCSKLYDVVRIDHFRAFSAYFSIPYGDETAVGGKWVNCPGEALFKRLEDKLGELNIIAEDLGTIDDDVRALLSKTGFPGMKVLQFAFDPDTESSYLPHNIGKNCVVYTGTHDNDTAIGYMKSAPQSHVKFMREYLRIGENESFNWGLIKSAMATPADTVILQMQDFLGLDNSARINTPATDTDNWQWRIGEGCTNDWLAGIIRNITALYYRLSTTKNKTEEK